MIPLDRDSGQRRDVANIKREHERVLGEKLFIAFLFFLSFLAVFLNRKIGGALSIVGLVIDSHN